MDDKSQIIADLIEFLSNPMENGSLKDFATAHSISPMTLWRIRRDNPQIDAEVKARMNKILEELRPAAYKALASKLGKGDTNAIKLYFQLNGDLVERTADVTEHLTLEQKRQMLSDLSSRLSHLKKVQENKE